MKQTGSFRQLVGFVPAANHILNGGVESGLGQTDEEADCDEGIESVRSGEYHGERAPNKLHSGDPHGRTDSGDDETMGTGKRGNEAKQLKCSTDFEGNWPRTYPQVQAVTM